MLAALLFALAAGGQRLVAPPQQPPDILIFDLDDVAQVDVATYGGPAPTPTLDALAARGVRFHNFQSAPTCAPSRRCLQTGQWWLTGNGAACGPAEANTPPLATVFLPEAAAGYSSALFGKWHLGGDPGGGPWEMAPVAQGWEFWLAGVDANVEECDGTGFSDWDRVDAGAAGFVEYPHEHAYEPVATASQFLLNWSSAPAPRLALVCMNLAHSPFHRPPAYALPPGYPATPTTRLKYEAEIAAYDYLIGQMLAAVDLDRTLVIVLGDNGTPPNVAGPDQDRAKGTTFRRGLETPLVIAGAGVAPGQSDELCHLVDLYATVAEASGNAVPPCRGTSLVPLLLGLPHPPPHDFVLCGNQWGVPGGDRAAVSKEGLKLRQLDDDGDGLPDREELYDEHADPGERVNVIRDPAYAAALDALRAFITAEAP